LIILKHIIYQETTFLELYDFSLRMCSYVGNHLRERERIDLDWLEDDIYVVLCYEFESDSGVDLRVIFVKVCEEFYW